MSRTRYPEPPVKYQGYSSLYYAPERQVRSGLTLAGYDRGELALSSGRVVFTGMRVLVDCPNVTAVGLVTKAFPWGIVAVVGVLAALAVYLTAPVPFTWRSPFPPLILAIVLVAAFLHWREQWVEVAHVDETGGSRKAYFRQRGGFLRSGNAATRRLCAEIRATVLTAEGPAAAAPLPVVSFNP
jgi:hypothetical protein